MYQLHHQYLDSASGFHVIELRDEHGNQHLMQIAVGHDACPACGAVHLKTNVGELDPDHVHTPGIYVKRIFQGTNYEKLIEKRTVRAREGRGDAVVA